MVGVAEGVAAEWEVSSEDELGVSGRFFFFFFRGGVSPSGYFRGRPRFFLGFSEIGEEVN